MPSFSRQDYRRIFDIGRLLWLKHQKRPFGTEGALGAELMMMAEGQLGPQPDFPARAREIWEYQPGPAVAGPSTSKGDTSNV